MGICSAILITRARYRKAGGNVDEVLEVATYIIPAGIIGGRLYHVLTSPDAYFGRNGHPIDALKIYEGGMGIWGAVGMGAAASFLYFKGSKKFGKKERSLSFAQFADAVVPGLLVAQAIGRWGNWFNNELFGRPTKLPWALHVPDAFRPKGFENFATFHPTFLYESIWCLLGAFLIFRISRLHTLGTLDSLDTLDTLPPGKLFLFYIAFYSFGRFWIESLRIDSAHLIWGLRLNMWVSALTFCVAIYFLRLKPSLKR